MFIRYRRLRESIFSLWIASIVCALALATPCRAQLIGAEPGTNGNDPSDVFLKAHAAIEQANKLEGDGKLRPALAKYRFAASLLEQLSQTNPNWQTLIVRYRARKTTDDIHRVGEKLALVPPEGIANEPTPNNALMGTAPGDPDDLPVPDNVPQPGVATVTPNGPVAEKPVRPGIPVEIPPEALDRAQRRLRDKLTQAQNELKTARDALEAAKKEKQEAVKAKDGMAYEMAMLKSQARGSQKKLERLQEDRGEIQKELDTLQARYKETVAKNPDAADTRKELREQIKELKKSLAKADEESKAANKERDTLNNKLAQSESTTAKLQGELEKSQKQNELTQDAANKIAALEGENSALTKKLADAETNILRLTEESQKKGEELAGMQKELTVLRDQLTSTRDQKDRAETQITELKQKVDETADQLAALKVSGKTGEDFARMTKENELLRGIVIRELKDHARREQARQLISEELAKLDVQSTALLNQQVEELARTPMLLTDDERALFKDPQVTISDGMDPSHLVTTFTMVKPSGPGGPAETPSESPDPGAAASPASAPGVAAASPSPTDSPAASPADGPKVSTNDTYKVSEENIPLARAAMEDLQRKRYVEAEKAYDKLLAREPKNPYVLYHLGVVYSCENKLNQAEIALKKAVSIDPRDDSSLSTLGIVYYRKQKYDDALACLTKAVQINSKNPTAHNYLGITSSQKGYPEAGLEELQKAIALNPNYADAHFNIAVIYATNQPPAKDQAQEHYKRATDLGATPDPALEKLIRN